MHRKLISVQIVMLICLVCAVRAGAQTFSGAQITGVVKDTSGAVLPGVSITAKNVDTNLTRTSISNESGVYTLPALPIGTYDVTAELAGFQSEIQKGTKLQVGDNLRINFDLAVGRVTDAVTVTGEVPTIQAESAALGTVVNNKIVTEMPLNGRVFYDLVQLVAGAVAPAPGSSLANRGGVNIAGARETSNAYTIDGIDNVSNGTNGPQVKLSIEMLQEFRVLTNSYSPEYGRGSGGNVVMSTRSGTNDYHGTVWEFLRNNAMDAKNRFDLPACNAVPAGQACGNVPPLHRSQFGYVFGGPVPKIPNLFFFQGYEGTRLNQSLTSVATVPVAAFHQGDFSSLLPNTVIRDPLTNVAFPGNIIPRNRWDPIGAAFLALYPNPTNGLATNNLVTNPIKSVPNDQLTGRIDYNRGKNNYYMRHIWNREGLREPFPGRGQTNGVPGFGWDDPLVGNNFMMGAALVFSPRVIGNFRYGINHMLEPNIVRNLIPFNQQIGLCCTSPLPVNAGRPSISPSGYSGVGDYGGAPGERDEWSHEVNYTQNILLGNHNLSAGSNWRLTHIDHKLPNARRGSFSFDGSLSTPTGQPISPGNVIADMLLGYPRQSQLTPDTANFRTHQRGSNPSAFFNDDWKVTPNLTVNLGLRWEFTTAMQDADDAISSFDFVTGKVIVPDLKKLPAIDPSNGLIGGILPLSAVEQSTYGRGLRNNFYYNFQPRVGFAYTLNPKSVIRAGYGMFTDVLSYGNSQIGFVQNSPWFPTKTYRVDNTTGPIINLSNSPFPDKVFNAPLLTFTGWDPNYRDGYVQNWNLTVQRELMSDLALEVAYTGSKGTKLFFAENVNQAFLPGGPLGSGSQQSRKLFPAFSNINREENSGDSHFHGVQAKIERRFTSGLSVLGTYMWSKSIDNSSVPGGGNVQDARNLRAQRALSDFDARQRFVTNFNYAIPLGNGHAFLSSGPAAMILGGWQMGGILTLQAGRPITPTISGDNSNTGAGSDRPNLIGDWRISNPSPAGWFNKCTILANGSRSNCLADQQPAWQIPAANTFGNGGRNIVIGPPIKAFDFSLMKNIPFAGSEKRKAQFRAEFFNIFNHPILVNLAAPILAQSGRVPTTSLSLEALTARCVHILISEGSLSYFAPVAKRPGFPRAVGRTLNELRMNAVDSESLRVLPRGGADLAELAECVERELARAKLADRATIFEAAVEAAQHSALGTQHLSRPLLLLDVPIQTVREADLIQALARHAPHTLATAAQGDSRSILLLERALNSKAVEADSNSPQIRAASGSQISADQRRSASQESANIGGESTTPVNSLTALKAHLFEDSKPDEQNLDDSVTLSSSPGEARECVEIARRIQAEAAAGTSFDKIAVFLRSPGEYRPHLEEAFRRAAIPAYFARGTTRPDPSGRALLALLACRAENFSARRFAEYTSLAQVPDPTVLREPDPNWAPPSSDVLPIGVEIESSVEQDLETEPLPVDLESKSEVEGTLRAPWRWERLLVESSVIGGKDRWKKRIEGLAAELQLRRKELLDEGEETRVAMIDGQLRDIGHLREFALPLIDELDALPDRATWGEWIAHLRRLAQEALRNPEGVLETLAELEPMSPIGPVDLNEVQLVLTPRLRELAVPPPRRRYGCVFVGSADAARGMSFEIVFVPGLAEKLFPRKVIEDPILLDEQRRRIGESLLTQSERIELERLALKLAVGAALIKVHLSYPRIDVQQARPRVPSFYGLEALRAAEGYLPGFDKLMRRAEANSSGRLGWPAPIDPHVAIDEAEYDLALLAPLIDADQETVAGTAHYLLSTNPHLARALRARSRRWLKRWTPSDGLVEPDDLAREALAAHQLESRSFSPTALQNYAACPYRFFLQAVHRLQPREDPAAIEVIDPLTRGSLFHKVQYQVLTMLRAAGLLPLTPSTCTQAIGLVDDVLDRVASTFEDKLAPAIDKVWEDGINAIRADLREWLRRASEADDGWVPFKFELAFGLADRDREEEDPASKPDPVTIDLLGSKNESHALKLRGSIDLVERHATGKLRATDHKTGKARAQDGVVVGGGEHLQPVLYALACERLLEGDVEGGRLYYCTSTGEFKSVEVPLDKISRAEAGDVVHIIGTAIEEGFLPAAPEKGACDWCDYRAVCGPLEYIRTSRKPTKALWELKRLRELP